MARAAAERRRADRAGVRLAGGGGGGGGGEGGAGPGGGWWGGAPGGGRRRGGRAAGGGSPHPTSTLLYRTVQWAGPRPVPDLRGTSRWYQDSRLVQDR